MQWRFKSMKIFSKSHWIADIWLFHLHSIIFIHIIIMKYTDWYIDEFHDLWKQTILKWRQTYTRDHFKRIEAFNRIAHKKYIDSEAGSIQIYNNSIQKYKKIWPKFVFGVRNISLFLLNCNFFWILFGLCFFCCWIFRKWNNSLLLFCLELHSS